jgi:hypothetical protein
VAVQEVAASPNCVAFVRNSSVTPRSNRGAREGRVVNVCVSRPGFWLVHGAYGVAVPVEFLTDQEAVAFGRYSGAPSGEALERFFLGIQRVFDPGSGVRSEAVGRCDAAGSGDHLHELGVGVEVATDQPGAGGAIDLHDGAARCIAAAGSSRSPGNSNSNQLASANCVAGPTRCPPARSLRRRSERRRGV